MLKRHQTRDVRKSNFGSVSVFKNPNRTQKVKPEIMVSVAFLKTEPVSYKQSIFEPFSQSFNILHVKDTVGQKMIMKSNYQSTPCDNTVNTVQRWLGGLLVERRTSVSQIRGSIPRQVAAV